MNRMTKVSQVSTIAFLSIFVSIMIIGCTGGRVFHPPKHSGLPPGGLVRDDLPTSLPSDGKSFPADRISLQYAEPHADLPDIDAILHQLMPTPIAFGRTADAFVAPRPEVPLVTLRLGELHATAHPFSVSAINVISAQVVDIMNQHGIVGVFVRPDGTDISPDGTDLRDGTHLRLVVYTGTIESIRTLAGGRDANRHVVTDERTLYQRVRRDSPLQSDDLITKTSIDEYIHRLNRHPGRRVEASLSPAQQAGKAVLDYHIHEEKPWMAYVQTSNTGTRTTDRWRHRAGFAHFQLTGNDDILNLDYVTAGFSESQAVMGSYEFPVAQRVRCRVQGIWSEFDASEVGAFRDERFTGQERSAGAEFLFNVFQHQELFIDAALGARWRKILVNNKVMELQGRGTFVLPHAGLRAQRVTQAASTSASLSFEWNEAGISSTNRNNITRLGRQYTSRNWQVINWELLQTFYLEPLFNRAAWEDPSSKSATLAHEIALSTRGQYAFDNRLISQSTGVIGGFYSVRGYPESAASGDDIYIGTFEYRLHIPKLFYNPESEPTTIAGRPFHLVPKQPYGRADWNLIFRTFFDIGYARANSAIKNVESNERLVGTGVGLELQVMRNLMIRTDYGIALSTTIADSNRVNVGDSRIHFAATLLW